MNEELCIKIQPLLKAVRAYHRHEVLGLNHIPKRQAAIVASTHSLATYDILLLMSAVYEETSRFPRSLIDRLFYKIPGIGPLMSSFGSVVGSPENARSLLSNGELLYLAPGGMHESLKPSSNKYRIYWQKRRGFAKLSIETGAPVILAACPSADDIFEVYDNKLTRMIYRKLKVPFFLASGVGFTAIPKPTKLIHMLSEPLFPPEHRRGAEIPDEIVEDFHAKLIQRMEEMIEKALRASTKAVLPSAK